MAPLSELPTEILEKILKPLDTTDLVSNVSCVNRELNSLAWREYLRRRDIAESKCIVIDNADAHLTLRALHTADWIKNVPALTVRLHLNHAFFRKIHSLARFIRGLDTLGALNLYISEIDRGFPTLYDFITIMELIPTRDLFYECFRALLNAAFSKGLEELHIYEPDLDLVSDHIDMRYLSTVQDRWDLRHDIKKGWLKLLSYVRSAEWHTKQMAEYSAICLCASCSLKACGKARIKDVRFSSMLSLNLLGWDAISMLRAHAPTIQTLDLDETLHRRWLEDKAPWGGFLHQLQFPLLERFTFTGAPEYQSTVPPTSIDALLLFLHRHPTIAHLEITLKPTKWEEPFTQETPSLSNLRTLIARDDVATHILQRPGNCERLELVHLWSPPNPMYLDRQGPGLALATIASNVSHPIKIELRLTDAANGWLEEDNEIPRKLTQVHEVRILLGVLTSKQGIILKFLPRWLGLFPVLEQLRVDVDDKHGAVLCPAILRSCPRLRSLMINEVVFHSRID